MFFDDRLATVLRQRTESDSGKRTQFRQLLDILGSQAEGARQAARDPSLVAAAWLRMEKLGGAIPADKRAAMIREAGWRFRNPELAAHLAEFEPEVASAALGRARLTSDDWQALIPRLPVRARGFLRLRRDLPVEADELLDRLGVRDRGLPSPVGEAGLGSADLHPPHDFAPKGKSEREPDSRPEPAFDPQSEGRSEISALVERIAQFKRSRDNAGQTDGDDETLMPRLPLGEEPSGDTRLIQNFGFAADAAGRIEWTDGEVAAMIIGTRLVARSHALGDAPEEPLERAIRRRQPIEAAAISLAGADAIAGDWVVDAQPRFTDGGNFAGYVGRFRRHIELSPATATAEQREADRIRQLLHELRTPVTAVQGYAEVIQQQLFGSAPHEYRALAAAIAADAARILAGFEELDRLARLETGAIEIEEGDTDLGELTQRITSQLSQVLTPRMAGIEVERLGTSQFPVAVEEGQLEGLLWRLLATLGGGCAAGELLEASITSQLGMAVLSCDIPAQLLSEEDVFLAEAKPIGTSINAGLFGAGFALRLARAEARAAGGDLIRSGECVVLSLPLRDASHEGDHEATGES